MRYVTIDCENGTFTKKFNDSQLTLIGFLLADDIGQRGGQKRIKWLLLPNNDDTSSNMTFMEKEDGSVTLGFLWDEDPYERALTVPIPVMIDLLEQWDAACKNNPTEVTIYYEDGKFKVEGVYAT